MAFNTAPDPARWARGNSRTLAATRILDLLSVGFRHPGRAAEREFVVIEAPDWVNVLALTPEDRLILVRQFRFGRDELSLEIPGGVVEKGEDPLAAGVRELAEETGFSGFRPRLLGSVHPNPAIQNNRCHILLVEGAVQSRVTDWDADEEIAVSTAPVGEVLNWARSGRITHSLVLSALFLFEGWWKERKSGEKG